MKARVKATGEIVDIAEYSTIYAENYDTCFYPNELEILDTSDDYWTRFEHQAAIAAMQGILAHYGTECKKYLPQEAKDIANALVEKYKKEE